MPSAVVAGAGLSGLFAAKRLRSRGYDVAIVNAAPQVGGLLSSVEHDGYIFDHGIHYAIATGIEEIDRLKMDLAGGLHAMEHAAIGMLPFFAMCDRADIGGVSTPLHPDTDQPQVFIYDGHPGGIGIAEKGFDLILELWDATLKTVAECPCSAGCPSCIQSPKCGNNNSPLDKAAAQLILERLLALPTSR